MADSNFVISRGYDAAAAITKFRAVKFTTAENTVTPVTASTDIMAGISEYDCTAAEILKGKGVNVIHIGIATVEAVVAINVGQLVAPDTSGRAQLAVSTNRIMGVCCSKPSTTSGDRIGVLLSMPGTILV